MIEIIVALIAVFGSSGACSLILYWWQKKDASRDMMRELGRVEIIRTGREYKARGWISYAELADYESLCKTYFALGGNGTGKAMHEEILKLEKR